MIGAEGYLAPREKFIQKARKINGTSRSLLERLVDFEMYALSVLEYLGSISALDRATLTEEAHALQCTAAGPNNAFPTDLLRANRTAANSGALVMALAKIRAARDYDGALHLCYHARM